MPNSRKFYMRVNENIVLPVEVHVLETLSAQCCWFEDKHLQEVVQIVREAVESRLSQAQTTGKGNQAAKGIQAQSAGKANQPSSAIITGDSLRLGYVFKARPGLQHCLVPTSCLSQQEQNKLEEDSLHSLTVAKEKLIIYACQRQIGSPQGMSQLVRVMGEKMNSTSKGVSISSYFQRLSGGGGAQSGASSTSTSPGATTGAGKSGGKRNILKKIVQKSDSNVSNKRKKTAKASSARRESTIHQFLCKDKDASTANKTETAIKRQENHFTEENSIVVDSLHSNVTDLNELANNSPANDRVNSENAEITVEQNTEIPNKFEGNLTAKKLDTTEQNGVRISQVFSAPVPLSTDETSAAGSVTLISVDQMHEIQQQKLAVSQLASTGSEKLSPVLGIENTVNHKVRYNSGSDLDDSLLPSASFVSQSGFSSPAVNAEMNSKLKAGLEKVTNFLSDSPKHDTVGDVAYSPIFLKKKSETITQKNVCSHVEEFRTTDINKETDSDYEFKHYSSEIAKDAKENEFKENVSVFSDSNINTGKNEPKHVKKTIRGSARLKRKLPNFSDSDGSSGVNEPGPSNNKNKENILSSQSSSQENKRLKKSLPDFSDSGSDDNVLPLISRKTRPPAKKKFVSLDEMNKKAKKFSISKSFFSGKDETVQPTLSFFMSDKSKKPTRSQKPLCSDSELNKEELENLDCTLIEELSFVVKVKGESDPAIRREIKELKEVSELNDEQLNFLVRTSESYLRDIFEGKIHSSRHLAYKKGGKSKRDLNYGSCMRLYSEEQIDTVMEALMKMFCKRHHKYLDYIMKVLLPEMLIKFHMEIHGLSKEESERKVMV